MVIRFLATFFGVLMSLGYYPQAYRIWIRKSAHDVSLISYYIFALGTLTWLLYGVYLHDTPIIASFVLGVVGSWTVLFLTVLYRNR